MRRRTALMSASAALAMSLLGACASEGDTPTPSEQTASASASANTIEPAVTDDALPVQVSGEVNPDVKPTVAITAPLSVTETSRKIVAKGTGPVVEATDKIAFAYTLYAGSTGEELDSSYGKTPGPLRPAQDHHGSGPRLRRHQRRRPRRHRHRAQRRFGDAVKNFGKENVDASTTIVVVADVVKIVPTTAEGTR